MKNYPPHIYVGVFSPMFRIHRTLFFDLTKTYSDLAIVAYPGAHLDTADTTNMLGIYQIPDEKIHVIPTLNEKEQLRSYAQHAEKIFCDFYTEEEKWFLHEQTLHEEFKEFLPKISWIEIAEEHKNVSSKAFWGEPERHNKWVHPDVFQLFVKNKILT